MCEEIAKFRTEENENKFVQRVSGSDIEEYLVINESQRLLCQVLVTKLSELTTTASTTYNQYVIALQRKKSYKV